MKLTGVSVLVVSLTSCSSPDPSPPHDAGSDGDVDGGQDGSVEELVVEPPEPPAYISWEPCPADWPQAIVDARAEGVICDPLPLEGLHPCPIGQAHFLGEDECRRVGRACPERWPTDIESGDGDLWYVDMSADGPGDGSQEDPYLQIGQALERASSGDTIVVAAGVYEENLSIQSSLSIIGACATETILRASATGGEPAIAVMSRDVHLSNLGIESATDGVFVNEGASAQVESLSIVEVDGFSIGVLGSLTGREVVAIGHVDPASEEGASGAVVDGGELELEGSVFRGHYGMQISISGESSVHIVDTIAGARDIDGELFGGMGIVATGGSQVSLERVVLDANLTSGIFVSGQGTVLDVERALIMYSDADDEYVVGESVPGGGIDVTESGEARARWVFIYEIEGPGMSASSGGMLRAEDVVISGNRGYDGDGFGISANERAQVELLRLHIIDVEEAALAIIDEGTECSFEDIRVRVVNPSGSEPLLGVGLYASQGAQVRGARLDLLGAWSVGVVVDGEATIDLEDVRVEEVYPDISGGWGGHALSAMGASTVTIDRLEVDRASSIALAFFDLETQVTLRNASIHDTFSFCPGCVDQIGGIGVGVYGGAHVDMESFLIADNALCAVQIAHGSEDGTTPNEHHGEIDLRDGIIESNLIGINVQAEGYDLERLTDGVIFRANGQDIDSTFIPVPAVPDFDLSEDE